MIFDKFRKKKENFEICSPVKGDVIDVTKTNDPLFKSEGLGKGVGIIAEENTLVSPVNGEIKTFFPTKHAIGITSDDGVDILIHLGRMRDKSRKVLKIVEVDLDSIKNEGYDTTVLLVITNTQEYSAVKSCEGNKTVDDTIIEIQK